MSRPRGAALAALMLCCSSAALADKPLWELGLGLGTVHLPHYRGSEQSHSWVLPVPYAVYRGDIFRADRDGARAVLLDNAVFDVDVSVAASAPTRSIDNRARSGMPDLAPTLEVGPNLNFTLAKGGEKGSDWKLALRLPLRAVYTLQRHPQSLGVTASPVLNLDLRLRGWNVGVQTGPLAASARYHAYYYDVPTAYASAARPAYGGGGGGGAAGWQATVGVSRRIGDFWLAGFVRGDSVRGARFEASPLVTQREHLAYGLALSWVFKTSEQRVADDR